MSFLETFLNHPRKLWIRRALFQIHLWAGVLLSLYVVIIALTGSILVFRAELTKAQLPEGLNPYDEHDTVSIGSVLQGFRAAYPGAKIEILQTPSPRIPAFLLFASDSHQVAFRLVADPVTGRLWQQPRTWLDWAYDLHVYLLLGSVYGMQVNGIGAAGLLLLTLSGMVLWWPGVRGWARGLGIDFSRNWRRINFDAHNAIGFWTLVIAFWWALSGIYFAWYRQVSDVIAYISPLHGMIAPKLPIPPTSGSGRASLEQLLAAIQQGSPPGGHLFSLSDPMLSGETVYALVDLRAPGDFSHRDIMALSTADARILTVWHYGQNQSAGDWILWAMHPLHFGTLWGVAFEVLWALCGIALAVLAITGLFMYWNRFLRHQFRS
jgi:uncharacterized iron-regulated membrane protein